jgi:lipoate-protein ligase A
MRGWYKIEAFATIAHMNKGKYMAMEIIESGKNAAADNMMRDQKLLESLEQNPRPILHLYDWKQPSATYGYFSDPQRFLNPQSIEVRQLQLAKRPTGGGIIFHQYDMAFSFLLPANHSSFSLNTLANYQLINDIVSYVTRPFVSTQPQLQDREKQSQKDPLCSFCMAAVTIYDVIAEGKKIAGSAQRKTKHGFLHQGSICLITPPDDFLYDIFLPGTPFAAAMKENSYPLLKQASESDITEVKASLRTSLMQEIQRRL